MGKVVLNGMLFGQQVDRLLVLLQGYFWDCAKNSWKKMRVILTKCCLRPQGVQVNHTEALLMLITLIQLKEILCLYDLPLTENKT